MKIRKKCFLGGLLGLIFSFLVLSPTVVMAEDYLKFTVHPEKAYGVEAAGGGSEDKAYAAVSFELSDVPDTLLLKYADKDEVVYRFPADKLTTIMALKIVRLRSSFHREHIGDISGKCRYSYRRLP